jgi:hypothetical protein
MGKEPIKLPPYFPRTSKNCKDVSSSFFSCYSEESLKPENLNQPGSGNMSLKKCEKLLRDYERCMKNDKQFKQFLHYRVIITIIDQYQVFDNFVRLFVCRFMKNIELYNLIHILKLKQ